MKLLPLEIMIESLRVYMYMYPFIKSNSKSFYYE